MCNTSNQNDRTSIGDTPDDGPDFDMTFQNFQASGVEVEDLSTVLNDNDFVGVNGRLYMGCLWAVPCVASGVGWTTIIGNREFHHPSLEVIELKLYHFALSEGIKL